MEFYKNLWKKKERTIRRRETSKRFATENYKIPHLLVSFPWRYFRSFGNAIFSYRNSSSESKKNSHSTCFSIFPFLEWRYSRVKRKTDLYIHIYIYIIYSDIFKLCNRETSKLIELQLKQRGYGLRAKSEREKEIKKMSVRVWSAMKRSTPDEPLPSPPLS